MKVNLILQINVLYGIDIYYGVNVRRNYLEHFQILWFTNGNSFIQGNITLSINLTFKFICTLVNNCSNNGFSFANTHLSSKLFH